MMVTCELEKGLKIIYIMEGAEVLDKIHLHKIHKIQTRGLDLILVVFSLGGDSYLQGLLSKLYIELVYHLSDANADADDDAIIRHSSTLFTLHRSGIGYDRFLRRIESSSE